MSERVLRDPTRTCGHEDAWCRVWFDMDGSPIGKVWHCKNERCPGGAEVRLERHPDDLWRSVMNGAESRVIAWNGEIVDEVEFVKQGEQPWREVPDER